MSRQDDISFSENPRKAFIGFLIYQLQPIVLGLYGNSQIMKRRSMGALIGIIDSLDKSSKEALANERKQLLEMQVSNGFDDSVLHSIYGNVTSYLHRTYLAEINWFKPMNPRPKHIGVGTDDSER